jgi:PAS domain S-box-containing protein
MGNPAEETAEPPDGPRLRDPSDQGKRVSQVFAERCLGGRILLYRTSIVSNVGTTIDFGLIRYLLYRLSRFGIPVAFVGMALMLRWVLAPVLHDKLPYSFFYVAVVLTAWNAGIAEAIVAVILGWAAAEWFFVEPRWSLLVSGPEAWVGDGLYCFIGLAIVWFMKSEQAARLRALTSAIEARRWREKLEAEQAHHREAHATQELLADLVNNAQDAIISLTPQGQITSWNAAAEALLEFSTQEAIGQSLGLFLSSESRAEFLVRMERVNRGERVASCQTVLKRSDGSSVRASLTVSPVRDRMGKVVGTSIIAREVEVAGGPAASMPTLEPARG